MRLILGENRRSAEGAPGAGSRENTGGAADRTARPASRAGRSFGANIEFR